jgi:hypothetical protein
VSDRWNHGCAPDGRDPGLSSSDPGQVGTSFNGYVSDLINGMDSLITQLIASPCPETLTIRLDSFLEVQLAKSLIAKSQPQSRRPMLILFFSVHLHARCPGARNSANSALSEHQGALRYVREQLAMTATVVVYRNTFLPLLAV